MPLKDVDLKTFEAYKNAIRQDVNKINTSGKTKFWLYKDIELPDAKGTKHKIPAFLALVDDSGIRTAVRGKQLLCSGTCGLEKDRVAFDAAHGKVPYDLLKTSVPLFLGKAVHVPPPGGAPAPTPPAASPAAPKAASPAPVHAASPAPTQAAVAPKPAAGGVPKAPPPPGSPAHALLVNWVKLEKQVNAAIAENPARKDALTRASEGIRDLIQANHILDAQKKLDAVTALLKATPAEEPTAGDATTEPDAGKATPKPAAGGVPKAPPPPGSPAHALLVNWVKLEKQVNAAIAENPARKDALTRASEGIRDLIQANHILDAQKKLDAVTALLKATPTEEPAAGDATTEPGADKATAEPDGGKPTDEAGKAATTRWDGLSKRMQAELSAHPERRSQIVRAGAGIGDMVRTGKLALAARLMDGLEKVLKGDPRAEEYSQRYQALEKRLLVALKNPGSDAGKLRAVSSFANEKAEAGDYGSALLALDRLDTALGPDPAVAATARWNALDKRRQAEMAAHPERKADLVRAGAGIGDMIKVGKLDLAKRLMDGVEKLLPSSE